MHSNKFVKYFENMQNNFKKAREIVLILIKLLCFCSGEHTIRLTNFGQVRGVIEHVQGHKKVEKFFAIPYASPPVGKLRFEPPVSPASWGDKILDARELPPACLQPLEGVAYIEYHVPGFNKTSEDCLYLNIYVPRDSHYPRSMPVLVFVHGGSYQNGMGGMFDGSVLATHGIVVVTFNYRLGPLGFLSAADGVIRGNYGMLDMIEALKWVKGNIAYFNGDPDRVTIDGHSAGGCSVGLLLMSPFAKDLFKRVIQQSGSPLGHWAVSRFQKKPEFIYKIFSSSVNCFRNTTIETKKCLQALDTEILEKVIVEEYEWSITLTPQYKPVVDGHFLPNTPERLVRDGELNAEDFMTGSTQDEGLIAATPLIEHYGVGKTGSKRLLSLMNCFKGDLPEIPGIADYVMDKYIEWGSTDITDIEIGRSFTEIVGDYFITAPTHRFADMLYLRNVSVYVYNYEYKSSLDQWDGVIHGAELFYLSGSPFSGHKHFRYEEVDKTMAKILLLLWSNFVKYGVPSLLPREEVYLPKFSISRKLYTRIYSGSSPSVSTASNLKTDKISFWNQQIPEMLMHQMKQQIGDTLQCGVVTNMNSYTPVIGKHTWILTSACIGLTVLTLMLTVGYYRVRKEVTRLLRQNSVSSGERMLPNT